MDSETISVLGSHWPAMIAIFLGAFLLHIVYNTLLGVEIKTCDTSASSDATDKSLNSSSNAEQQDPFKKDDNQSLFYEESKKDAVVENNESPYYERLKKELAAEYAVKRHDATRQVANTQSSSYSLVENLIHDTVMNSRGDMQKQSSVHYSLKITTSRDTFGEPSNLSSSCEDIGSTAKRSNSTPSEYIKASTAVVLPKKKDTRTLTQRAVHKIKKRRQSLLEKWITAARMEGDRTADSTALKKKDNETRPKILHPTLGQIHDDHETRITSQIGDAVKLVQEVPGETATLHLLVLVHGIRGAATDLSYLKSQIVKHARQRLLERRFYEDQLQQSLSHQDDKEHEDTILEEEEDVSDLSESDAEEGESHRPTRSKETCFNESLSNVSNENFVKRLEWFTVHAATCNEGLTDDGVGNGGERLTQEIFNVIKKELDLVESTNPNVKVAQVTLSLVGNSLGGLYSRYAAARVADFASLEYEHSMKQKQVLRPPEPCMTVYGRRLRFSVFCTTASPHLGIADHTYIRVPRSIEVAGAYALFGNTGRDIFRLTDLLRRMATAPYFLDPLAYFNQRIAFANAYSTDFAVPTETAAFLHRKSPSLHTFVDALLCDDEDVILPQNLDLLEEIEQEVKYYQDNPLIVAALRTKPTYVISSHRGSRDHGLGASASWESSDELSGMTDEGLSEAPFDQEALQEETDELVLMATSLDSLGWKKVFVDMRDQMPALLPTPKLPKLMGVDSILSKAAVALPSARVALSDSITNHQPQMLAHATANDVATHAETSVTTAGAVAHKALSSLVCTAHPTKRTTCKKLSELREKLVVPSKDLADILSAKEKIGLPLGHNMMVAHTKPRSVAMNHVNQRGRPVMDSLAQELVEAILQ